MPPKGKYAYHFLILHTSVFRLLQFIRASLSTLVLRIIVFLYVNVHIAQFMGIHSLGM